MKSDSIKTSLHFNALKRIRLIPWFLSGLFATWGLFVWFWADHEWWPVFLYYPLYPVSVLIERGIGAFRDHLVPDPTTASPEAWTSLDYFSGLVYLVCGFVWYFMIGAAVRWAIWRFRADLKGERRDAATDRARTL